MLFILINTVVFLIIGMIVSAPYLIVKETVRSYLHSKGYKVYTKEELDKQVGDLVLQMIVTGLENNDLIYTGGTDENRNQNTEQFNL